MGNDGKSSNIDKFGLVSAIVTLLLVILLWDFLALGIYSKKNARHAATYSKKDTVTHSVSEPFEWLKLVVAVIVSGPVIGTFYLKHAEFKKRELSEKTETWNKIYNCLVILFNFTPVSGDVNEFGSAISQLRDLRRQANHTFKEKVTENLFLKLNEIFSPESQNTFTQALLGDSDALRVLIGYSHYQQEGLRAVELKARRKNEVVELAEEFEKENLKG